MRKDDRDPLPPHLMAEVKVLDAMSDDDIDYSDIPKTTDFTGWTRRGDRLVRVAAAGKRTVSVALDAELVEYAEKFGSLDDKLNALLRNWVSNSRQAAE